jgi:hypothetical protein
MKKFELILGIFIIVSLIMKLFMIPFAAILLSISLSLLAIYYFIFGTSIFKDKKLKDILNIKSFKAFSSFRKFESAGVGLSLICIGILYSIEHLPGADLFLVVGLIYTLIALVIALIRFQKNKENYYKRILKRITIIGGFGLFMLILPELTLEKIQYRDNPEYIKAYEEYLKDPQNEDLRNKCELEYNRANLSKEDFYRYEKHIEKHK